MTHGGCWPGWRHSCICVFHDVTWDVLTLSPLVCAQLPSSKDLKLAGMVNGADGTVIHIELGRREEDDAGGGRWRVLKYPPEYLIFRPDNLASHPEATDAHTGKIIPAGCFIIKPRNYSFDCPIRAKNTCGGTSQAATVKMTREKAFYIEQAYAIIDLGTQGSTYGSDTKIVVDVLRTLKAQSWYDMGANYLHPPTYFLHE